MKGGQQVRKTQQTNKTKGTRQIRKTQQKHIKRKKLTKTHQQNQKRKTINNKDKPITEENNA